MMSLTQHLLLKLFEEAGEVGKEASKASQFGFDEMYAPIGKTNRERIHGEIDDFLEIVNMLNDYCDLQYIPKSEAWDAKREKVIKYLRYSVELGQVHPDALKEFDND